MPLSNADRAAIEQVVNRALRAHPAVRSLVAAEEEHRNQLVQSLEANCRVPLTREDLSAIPTPALERMAASYSGRLDFIRPTQPIGGAYERSYNSAENRRVEKGVVRRTKRSEMEA